MFNFSCQVLNNKEDKVNKGLGTMTMRKHIIKYHNILETPKLIFDD